VFALRFRNLVLLLGATTALAACGDDDDGGTGVSTRARVRAVHAVADAPPVNVLVDAQPLRGGNNLAYGNATSYTAVDAGARTVRVNLATTGATVIEAPGTFAAATDYTVLATGSAAGTITPIVLTDDNTAPPSGQAKIRIIHASPTAGSVDVYATTPNGPLTDISRIVPNAAFGTSTAVSGYIRVPAGRYQIRVAPTGTATPAINSEAVDLRNGQIRTFVIYGTGSLTAPYAILRLDDR